MAGRFAARRKMPAERIEIHVQYNTKPYSMPVHDGSGSNQDERFPPPRPERSQRNPEHLVQGSQSSARRKGKSNRESRQYRAKNFSWPVPPALAFTPRGMFPKVAWMLSGL